MNLHKPLILGLSLCVSAISITTYANQNNQLPSQDVSHKPLTAAETELGKTIIFQSSLDERCAVSGELLFKHNIPIKAEILNKIEKKIFPTPTQNKRMKAVLKDEEVVKIIEKIRNECKKINDKYNQALLLSAESPTDANLQEMTKKLHSYDEKVKKIENKINKLLKSDMDGTTKQIKKTIVTLLNDYKTKLKPIFIQASLINLTSDTFNGLTGVTEKEKLIVNTAMSLVNKIPYQWGGKATNGGWNKRWDKKGNGMDCSGFVEWVYWTINGKPNENLRSTIVIADKQKQIKYEGLRVGDLGMKYPTGTRYADYSGKIFNTKKAVIKSNLAAGKTEEEVKIIYNHVGIYVGKDMNGNDLWVHCTGEPISTVTVGTYEDFIYYYNMPN